MNVPENDRLSLSLSDSPGYLPQHPSEVDILIHILEMKLRPGKTDLSKLSWIPSSRAYLNPGLCLQNPAFSLSDNSSVLQTQEDSVSGIKSPRKCQCCEDTANSGILNQCSGRVTWGSS